jgi:perosamine synthetase
MELSKASEVSTRGNQTSLFEKDLSSLTKFPYVIASHTGSAALELGLKAMGVMPNSLVLMPSMTYVATAAAAIHLGAEVVFLDTESDLPLLSAEALREFLQEECQGEDPPVHQETSKPISAIVPVYLMGEPPNLKEIFALADEYNIPVLIDQAQGLGSAHAELEYQGHRVLSFNGNKIVKTGGGGAVMTTDPVLAEKLRWLARYAPEPDSWYTYDEVGYNYLMPSWNAALGRAQLPWIQDFLSDKRKRRNLIREMAPQYGLQLIESPYGIGNAWVNAIRVPIELQELFKSEAAQAKVEVSPVWTPLHRSRAFASCIKENLRNTEALSREIFLLG